MSIKLIGLDLDGTTLNKEKQITSRTKKALEEAAKMGVHVVIATGRGFHSMPDAVYNVAGLEYSVNSNGAQIRELATEKVIYENYIDVDAVMAAKDFLENNDNMIEVFVGGTAHIEQSEFEAIRDYKRKFRARDYVLQTRKPVVNLLEFMEKNKDKVENINIFFESDEVKWATFEELKVLKNVTVTTSLPDNLEIGGSTTSKAIALMYLANKYGITKDEIMCCGDSPNDIPMLELAGTAVAMENAHDEVKAVCNYHTDNCDEDGVAKAIEKLVLK